MKKIDSKELIRDYKNYLSSMTAQLKAGNSLKHIMNGLADKELELFEKEVFNEYFEELTWIEDAYQEGLNNGDDEVKEWFNFDSVYDFIYDQHSYKHKDYIEYYINQGNDSIVNMFDILKCYIDALHDTAVEEMDAAYEEVADGANAILADKGLTERRQYFDPHKHVDEEDAEEVVDDGIPF